MVRLLSLGIFMQEGVVLLYQTGEKGLGRRF
jgi:hypothetical protein